MSQAHSCNASYWKERNGLFGFYFALRPVFRPTAVLYICQYFINEFK